MDFRLRIGDKIVANIRFILLLRVVLGLWRVDRDVACILLLWLHVVRVQCRVEIVRLLAVPADKDDHLVKIFLQLGHISRDIVFVEDNGAVVVLMVADACEGVEFGLVEHANHVLHVLRDVGHLVLHKRDLGLLLCNLNADFLSTLAKLLTDTLFVRRRHRVDFLVHFDFSFDLLVLLVDHIDLAVKHIDIVPK